MKRSRPVTAHLTKEVTAEQVATISKEPPQSSQFLSEHNYCVPSGLLNAETEYDKHSVNYENVISKQDKHMHVLQVQLTSQDTNVHSHVETFKKLRGMGFVTFSFLDDADDVGFVKDNVKEDIKISDPKADIDNLDGFSFDELATELQTISNNDAGLTSVSQSTQFTGKAPVILPPHVTVHSSAISATAECDDQAEESSAELQVSPGQMEPEDHKEVTDINTVSLHKKRKLEDDDAVAEEEVPWYKEQHLDCYRRLNDLNLELATVKLERTKLDLQFTHMQAQHTAELACIRADAAADLLRMDAELQELAILAQLDSRISDEPHIDN